MNHLDKCMVAAGFAAAAVLALGGCGIKPRTEEQREATYQSQVLQRKAGQDPDAWAVILVDHETGCEYISSYGNVTPRLGVNGRPICPTKTVVGKDGIEREAF